MLRNYIQNLTSISPRLDNKARCAIVVLVSFSKMFLQGDLEN